MTILDEIVSAKKKEVEARKARYPEALLKESAYFETKTCSLKEYLGREDLHGIIAEIKRASPSKGVLNPYIQVEELSVAYMQSGASALSVLTDEKFFQGSLEDLQVARRFNFCPILRKDFIIDPYQVVETRSIGADVMLLIAACLDAELLNDLAAQARALGLEVLLEIHKMEELNDIELANIDILGVNNRNLDTFDVDAKTSLNMATELPKEISKISESGISEVETLRKLKSVGFQGFLIGEAFMKHRRPARACRKFISQLERE